MMVRSTCVVLVATAALLCPCDAFDGAADRALYAARVRGMFDFSWSSYLRYGFPMDELTPLSCGGRDTWGSYVSLKLIDAEHQLFTLACCVRRMQDSQAWKALTRFMLLVCDRTFHDDAHYVSVSDEIVSCDYLSSAIVLAKHKQSLCSWFFSTVLTLARPPFASPSTGTDHGRYSRHAVHPGQLHRV